MKRTWTFTLLQHEQPDDAVWRELLHLVSQWNQGGHAKFTRVADFMWLANFDETTRPQMERLRADLEALRQRRGAAFHLSWRSILEEDDYAKADFIEILGVGLGSPNRLFLVNEASAFDSGVPCARCGAHNAFSAIQREPLVIDERLLDGPDNTGSRPPVGGWDLVNLANGQKLVSQRLARLLDEHDVEGYDLVEVNDSATQRASTRMFQFAARRAILTPCPEHTSISGGPFCPVCGSAQGVVEGYFWIRDTWLGGDEIVSRHPNRGAMLYVSHRIHDLLVAAKLSGIHRHDVMRVCRHR